MKLHSLTSFYGDPYLIAEDLIYQDDYGNWYYTNDVDDEKE